MNGIHDMGGMHGFGPVRREENEPVFHEPWEGRLFGMQMSGMVPLFPSGDAARYALEQLDPAEYVSCPLLRALAGAHGETPAGAGHPDPGRTGCPHPLLPSASRRGSSPPRGPCRRRAGDGEDAQPPAAAAGLGQASQVPVGGSGPHPERAPRGAPPAAALRARAPRYHRPAPRLSRPRRRHGPGGPQPRGALQRQVRRGRALGGVGRGKGRRVHRPLGQLSRTRRRREV